MSGRGCGNITGYPGDVDGVERVSAEELFPAEILGNGESVNRSSQAGTGTRTV